VAAVEACWAPLLASSAPDVVDLLPRVLTTSREADHLGRVNCEAPLDDGPDDVSTPADAAAPFGVDPNSVDGPLFCGLLSAWPDDEFAADDVDDGSAELGSADATPCPMKTAAPTPRATASPPTRPTYRAEPMRPPGPAAAISANSTGDARENLQYRKNVVDHIKVAVNLISATNRCFLY
jgi:hypothetical protein